MKISIGERFREAVDFLLYKKEIENQADLVQKLGLSKGYVSQMLSGKKEPSETAVDALLSAFPEISREWMLTGRGSMNGDNETHDGIPVIPIDAIAGYGNAAFGDLRIEDYYSVGVFKNVDFLIRVSGDSMSPKYCGGDLIACRFIKDLRFFQWGRIYVIDTKSQGIIVKRVEKSPEVDSVVCVSENPRYDQFEIPTNDISHIALVVGAITLE